MDGYATLIFLFFVTNQNDTTYVFIPTPGTWNFAQEYCGEHHTDLAVIRTAVENDKVFSVKPPPAQVWIGPHRVRWTWADSSQSSFRNWKADEPENCDGDQLCAAENDLHEWIDTNCQNKNTFICHQGECSMTKTNFWFNQIFTAGPLYFPVAKLRTVVRLTTETNADMTDPAIQAQILQQTNSRHFVHTSCQRWLSSADFNGPLISPKTGAATATEVRLVDPAWNHDNNRPYLTALDNICQAIREAFPVKVDVNKIGNCKQEDGESVQAFYQRFYTVFNENCGMTEPANREGGHCESLGVPLQTDFSPQRSD
ncbi:hypothetical protein F2P81_016486 [Scophthalmus maximus]|uniref:C-type lectin domain-containing protein n=1 Tax=Scophthalmus maximus TaxID=52904 RepID=A0A6A4SLB4_SCOMX|nr:hypothetical protein F2P81_016486 [Scophthalmus maximus]